MKIRTRIETKHVRGCGALRMVREGRWNTPWALLSETEPTFYNRETNRHALRRWLRFRCNDTHCSGTLLVNTDDVLAAVAEGGT